MGLLGWGKNQRKKIFFFFNSFEWKKWRAKENERKVHPKGFTQIELTMSKGAFDPTRPLFRFLVLL